VWFFGFTTDLLLLSLCSNGFILGGAVRNVVRCGAEKSSTAMCCDEVMEDGGLHD
jgi:hypothetical protein